MNRLFNLDNPFWKFFSKVCDIIILNAIFIISCIPVITIGASISALYYVCLKMIRKEEPYIWKNFWKAFRQNFKQSTIIWLISIAAAFFLGMDYYIINSQNTALFAAVRIGLWAVTIVLFSMFIYIFPIISHFECTLKQAVKNSIYMTIGHLPFSALLVAMFYFVIYFFTISVKTAGMVIILSGICGFSIMAYFACIILDRIFKKYEPETEPVPEYGDM